MKKPIEKKQDRRKPSDEIQIQGYVTVYQGEGEDKEYLIKRAKNHFVDAGLKGLVSALVGNNIESDGEAWSYNLKMYVGDDTVTVTAHNLTALASPIGAAPGTAPDNTSGEDLTNPATGEWEAKWIATWYAGSLSGTFGEVALYLGAFDSITPGWSEDFFSYSSVMVSRLSDADGDFTNFAINPAKSLTVEWEVEITYA